MTPPSRQRSRSRPILRLEDGRPPGRARDQIAVEEPLEIRIGGRPFVVTMRTPGDDEDLAAGLLATEGFVTSPEEIARIAPCLDLKPEAEGNVLDVSLSGDAPFRWSRAKRPLMMNSACGLCGQERIEQVTRRITPLDGDRVVVSLARLLSFPDRLRGRQRTFDRTGGLHAAALFSAGGKLLASAEDVGRHNAVDKILGRLFRAGRWPLRGTILMVSGRASFEIVQKGAVAGVPIVAAVSAPSSLAVDLAIRSGQTLAGFVRPGRANLYSGFDRIDSSGDSPPTERVMLDAATRRRPKGGKE